METNRRFSLLTFPQFFDGNVLKLNIVVLPRNQNPLQGAIATHPTIPDAPAFAAANLSFNAGIITGLSRFPNNQAFTFSQALTTTSPTNQTALFEALANQFSINNLNQTNINLDSNTDKANKAVVESLSVKKYLPLSYRNAFNFTTPRIRNAVTDDSYQCAVRDAGKVPGFNRSGDDISWGKVFAYALRQPQLAKQLGMIYGTTLTIDAAYFPDGGWLYIDLAEGSDYWAQQQVDDSFIKKYAARIPALKPGITRPVFAPLLFPVLFKNNAADPDPMPDGNFDTLQIETATYDDGFAKIVHVSQPHSRNLMAEESDGAHPVKDVGIRLGWDDEQILIWYMRQMAIDPSVANPDQRIDAPLGVFGYSIDVRDLDNPASPWESLNTVQSKAELTIAKDKSPEPEMISIGSFKGELPYQVYPVQLDGNQLQNYWLPIYFANWNGHNIVLPDPDAAAVYQTNNPDVKADPEVPVPGDPSNKTGTGVTGAAQNQLNRIFDAGAIATQLRYGKQYEFRVRLRDLSGGSTPLLPTVNPINESPSKRGRSRFKRYVAPNQPRLEDLPVNTDALPGTDTVPVINQLTVLRPLLGYPAVVYTGKYTNPVQRLIDASNLAVGKEAFGIPDPDVNRVQITVEVQTLRLDNLLSVSGKDNYVHLYTTERKFGAIASEDDYATALNLPIVYKDCKVLHVGDEVDLITDLQLPDEIDKLTEIVLPTARTIRLTIRAICEDKTENDRYYGLLNLGNPDQDVRFGQIVQVMLYKASSNETALFVAAPPAQTLQGIYLQPDPPVVFDGKFTTLFFGKQTERAPDLIQRLAKQLQIENVGLTLTAPKGERLQFGCSNRIRHTLSPENSSLTFSSKGDLLNHWLCCVNLQLDRDWTWDALQDQGFVIKRTLRFTHDSEAEAETVEVGDIEIRRTASYESLQTPQRNFTRLIFIDAVEPKNPRMQPPPNDTEPRFPDTIEVSYTLEPRFKPSHAAKKDTPEPLKTRLPITLTPAQIPKIVSAGIALSPYRRNEKYSATEPRQRYLWIEFEEPIKDPNDTYFGRVLAYTSDQLISNNHPELFVAPQEPTLPIDPEYIRVIPPNAINDLAGLNAMQPMQKSTDSDRHYILPLPPGLHADADEMFGFFTYEFRVGHYRNRETKEMAWCTAQGRFGRSLRATGIQHPAPTLTCTVQRDEEKLYVSAAYAVAVFNGKNVTAEPPRTQLWCLLYAQVRQADNKDNRNLLLDNKQLDWRVQIEQDKQVNRFIKYDDQQRDTLKNITIKNWKDEISYGNLQSVYKLVEFDQLNKDAKKYGTVVWSNSEVIQLLQLYGLPEDASLSVLVVEILPMITNIYEHITNLGQPSVREQFRSSFKVRQMPSANQLQARTTQLRQLQEFQRSPSPLAEGLGNSRILRTSPLTEVPFICCINC